MVASHGTQILPYLEPRHLELWNLSSACSQNRPPKSVEPCLTAVFSGYAERGEARTCGLCNPGSPPPHGAASTGDNSESQPFLVTLTGVGGATGDRVQERHSTSTRSSRGTSGVMGALTSQAARSGHEEPVVSVMLGGGRWRSQK